MIIKSKGMSIKAVDSVLEYILREGAQFTDANGRPVLFKQHLRGNTPQEWAREYVLNEMKRKRKNKRARGLYHVILSIHPKDSKWVTSEMLENFVRHFISLRCPNSLVVATAHREEHIHLHLVVSGVQYGNYESIHIDRSTFSDILQKMEMYQELEYPQLEFSKVPFGKNSLGKDAEYQMRSKGIVPEKHLAVAYAKAAYETAESLGDFLECLKENGFEPYNRNGQVVGIQGKRKYRFSTIGVLIDRFKTMGQEIHYSK